MKSLPVKCLIFCWNGVGIFFFPNLQIKLHFCSDDVIFFGSLYLKCFGSFSRSPAIGSADCCMESICCNTEIPAVPVCPERDYRIFLNWSSIHLSIKIRSRRQERNGSIKCTWGIYNTQQDGYNRPLNGAGFRDFMIPHLAPDRVLLAPPAPSLTPSGGTRHRPPARPASAGPERSAASDGKRTKNPNETHQNKN